MNAPKYDPPLPDRVIGIVKQPHFREGSVETKAFGL